MSLAGAFAPMARPFGGGRETGVKHTLVALQICGAFNAISLIQEESKIKNNTRNYYE